MDVYVYHAAFLCDHCGIKTKVALDKKGVEDTGDSDDYPQGPYGNGGGEADTAQHCDQCSAFLENSLTTDGMEDVARMIAEDIEAGELRPYTLEYVDFYDFTLKELAQEGLVTLNDVMKLLKGYPKVKK